jgi:hypothetical protein
MNITKEWLLKLHPCSDGLAFANSCGFDFTKIWETCPRGDWLIWLLRQMDLLDKPTAVRMAIACAEHVLEHVEKKYPLDKRPRKAIEAARKWLEDPTADAAAYDAYAAAAAAYAAASAYASADASADADAAASAYAYAIKSERKWQADKIRELIPYPFSN